MKSIIIFFFVINLADTIKLDFIKSYLGKYSDKNLLVIQGHNYNLFNAAFMGVFVSGTITLEAAICKLKNIQGVRIIGEPVVTAVIVEEESP